MKKIILVLAVLVALTPTLAGCGGGSSDVIKVGLNFELSGGVATYGQDTVKGVEMAIKEINDAGGIKGKKIELVKLDNKSEQAESTSVAARLMEQEKVVACLGPATSGNYRATIPGAQANKVPVISASATANGLTLDTDGSVFEYVFRVCFTDSFQGVTMANFSLNNLNGKKAAIYKDTSSDYAMGLAESYREQFELLGGTIVAEEGYVAKDTDFRAVLTGLKGNDFDVMFVPGYYEEAGLIIAQARELGIMVPILGADGFDSPILLELAGAAALSNVYFSNHYSSLDDDPVVIEFIKKWGDANNGESPGAFHALGYDLGKFVVDAIQRAGSADKEAIKNALASTTNFVGVTGSFKMGDDHNPLKAVVVIEMQNGQQVKASKVAA